MPNGAGGNAGRSALANTIVAQFLSMGDIILYDSYVTAVFESRVLECTVNNLNNSFSKMYILLELEQAPGIAVYINFYMYETWDNNTHTGTFPIGGRVANNLIYGTNIGGNFHTLMTFSHPEFKGIAYIYNGTLTATLGWIVPVSRFPLYDRNSYLYAFLLDLVPYDGANKRLLAYAPQRNPWGLSNLVLSSPNIQVSGLDPVFLTVPSIRGIPLYNENNKILIGALGSDFALSSRTPTINVTDQIIEGAQISRPIYIGSPTSHSILVNTNG
jgi:hypothetical protein